MSVSVGFRRFTFSLVNLALLDVDLDPHTCRLCPGSTVRGGTTSPLQSRAGLYDRLGGATGKRERVWQGR